jgi:hypothetical protein
MHTSIHHRYDDLPDMVMVMLASLDRNNLICLLSLYMLRVRPELGHLSVQTTLDLLSVIVLECLGLNWEDLGNMLLLESLRISDGLD